MLVGPLDAITAAAVVGLSNLMADAGSRIASIDVNPFLINSKLGVAVNGLIVLNNEAARVARGAPERDDFSSNRHPALSFCLRMILSENRYPLFRIML
jgi:hypothetical protein